MAVLTIPKKILDKLVAGVSATVSQAIAANLKVEIYNPAGTALATYSYGYTGAGIMPIRVDGAGYLLTKITDGTETATVTEDGWLDVKTHSSDKCFAADYAGAQAAVVIITPTAGKKARILSIYVSTNDNTTDITLAFGTSGNIFFKLYTDKKQAHTGNVVCADGAVDETIKITCGAGTFVSIAYDEV